MAWYVESTSPSSECVTYYVDEAQRTIDIADDESFIACLAALFFLLPQVIEFLSTEASINMLKLNRPFFSPLN